MGNQPTPPPPPAAFQCCSTISKPSTKAMVNVNLLQGAQLGDVEKVKQALQDGADVETRRPLMLKPQEEKGAGNKRKVSSTGLTPLMYAAKDGQQEIVRMLINNKAKINAVEVDRWAALHFAGAYGNQEAAKLLLEADADVNLRNGDGATPLTLALTFTGDTTSKGPPHTEVATLLQQSGGVDAREVVDNNNAVA